MTPGKWNNQLLGCCWKGALQLHMVGMMFFFLGVLQSIWFRFNYAIAIVSSAILGAGVLIFLHVYRRQQWRFSLTWNKED